MGEYIIRHNHDILGKMKSSISRFDNSLFGTAETDQHRFLLTKTDGSQRVVVGNYVEFDVETNTLELFKSTGHVTGTIMKNVEEVEELE